MNVIKEWKILQIIPAQAGWKAVCCQESDNRQIEISNRGIICWALVEARGEDSVLQTEVRGVVQQSNHLVIVGDFIKTSKVGEEEVDGNQYFLGYNDPEAHKESDHWINQAKARLKRERDQRGKEGNLPSCFTSK